MDLEWTQGSWRGSGDTAPSGQSYSGDWWWCDFHLARPAWTEQSPEPDLALGQRRRRDWHLKRDFLGDGCSPVIKSLLLVIPP